MNMKIGMWQYSTCNSPKEVHYKSSDAYIKCLSKKLLYLVTIRLSLSASYASLLGLMRFLTNQLILKYLQITSKTK
ncbi:MAG: hypothetical protein JWR68_1098 [Polaromonas sp.]|nr:hypothetical protein [Polaromonas sp.]